MQGRVLTEAMVDFGDIELGPSDFVALVNQTLEFACPGVTITGELANFRVSKNQWVYFDLKDELSSVKFFGTVYQLPGPLEDGMLVRVRGAPRLHPLYGFSVTVQSIVPSGEGSMKKAAQLLQQQLAREGLFDAARKRPLPYPPQRVGLVTSGESAAFRDFMKIVNDRWGGMEIMHIDVQVQGEPAIVQIVRAIEQLNSSSRPPEIIIVTRGGGSADDLQAFNSEEITRAIAASRVPTLVAIGHEVDVSLAELAADVRASTPSNAAELLVPDRKSLSGRIAAERNELARLAAEVLSGHRRLLAQMARELTVSTDRLVAGNRDKLAAQRQLLQAFHPQAALTRGYALVRRDARLIARAAEVGEGEELTIEFADGELQTIVKHSTIKKEGVRHAQAS